jgi:membrane protease YdiL (CAAX protease family)
MVWVWALLAGGIGLVALVFGLKVVNRLVILPVQEMPDLSHVPGTTILPLLLLSAPVAGVVEESAFRGYMQGPLERRYGLGWAILITGTAFALVHLDFTLILWPYYLAVAALYGTVTYLTGSILPAVVLHTSGNLYSNLDLWFRGRAEWQTGTDLPRLIWETGVDAGFQHTLLGFLVASIAMAVAFHRLARVARPKTLFVADA